MVELKTFFPTNLRVVCYFKNRDRSCDANGAVPARLHGTPNHSCYLSTSLRPCNNHTTSNQQGDAASPQHGAPCCADRFGRQSLLRHVQHGGWLVAYYCLLIVWLLVDRPIIVWLSVDYCYPGSYTCFPVQPLGQNMSKHCMPSPKMKRFLGKFT